MGASQRNVVHKLREQEIKSMSVDLFDAALRLAVESTQIKIGPKPMRRFERLQMPKNTLGIPRRLASMRPWFRFHCGARLGNAKHQSFELRVLALLDVIRCHHVSDWITHNADGAMISPDLIEAAASVPLNEDGSFPAQELFERAASIEWEDTFGRLKKLSDRQHRNQ